MEHFLAGLCKSGSVDEQPAAENMKSIVSVVGNQQEVARPGKLAVEEDEAVRVGDQV